MCDILSLLTIQKFRDICQVLFLVGYFAVEDVSVSRSKKRSIVWLVIRWVIAVYFFVWSLSEVIAGTRNWIAPLIVGLIFGFGRKFTNLKIW
jgi:hypothetical protein